MYPLLHWTAGAAPAAATLIALSVPTPSDASLLPAASTGDDAGPVERLRVEVLDRYPHDTEAFTQGLELHDGLLYESTGRFGESDVRTSTPETGEVQRLVELPEDHFGEGLTVAGDTLWQLTWLEGVAYQRDVETLEETAQADYPGAGWGLCYDEGSDILVMSDGSAELTFRDPGTFDPLFTTAVTLDGEPLTMINELECVDGAVWANVWLTDDIVRIDPVSGEVTAVVDAAGLLTDEEQAPVDVLNGIAAVPDSDAFLITGKLWPWVFLVEFAPEQ